MILVSTYKERKKERKSSSSLKKFFLTQKYPTVRCPSKTNRNLKNKNLVYILTCGEKKEI